MVIMTSSAQPKSYADGWGTHIATLGFVRISVTLGLCSWIGTHITKVVVMPISQPWRYADGDLSPPLDDIAGGLPPPRTLPLLGSSGGRRSADGGRRLGGSAGRIFKASCPVLLSCHGALILSWCICLVMVYHSTTTIPGLISKAVNDKMMKI